MIDTILENIFKAMCILLMVMVIVIILALAFGAINPKETKECQVYGEEETRKGFTYVGKIYVPTTYKHRECLVYGSK